MVPTHFSNLDSILIGWIIHSLDCLRLLWCGIKSFNIKIIRIFLIALVHLRWTEKKECTLSRNFEILFDAAVQKGAHSYLPGGTRSRSGRLEFN